MLTNWQFNILFVVGVGGALVLLFGPELGLQVSKDPVASLGVGAILTYVLQQKEALTKQAQEKAKAAKKDKPPEEEG